MKLKRFIAAMAVAVGATGAVNAELIATPLTGDTRLVQFNYDENNTFLILAKPKAITHLQFSNDETILSVAAGDTNQWDLTPTKTRKHLFIKPKYEGLETSMTVITDKRIYQISLRSTGDNMKWYQRVSWQYSEEMLLEMDAMLNSGNATSIVPLNQGVTSAPGFGRPAATAPANMVTPTGGNNPVPFTPPISGVPGPSAGLPSTSSPSFVDNGNPASLQADNLRFNYDVVGDAPFKPVMAFDDGKFTYLKMPPNLQELPALFAVIDGADYSLVNYTVRGDYMVAQRLLDVGVLKLGKAEVRVKRKDQMGKRDSSPVAVTNY